MGDGGTGCSRGRDLLWYESLLDDRSWVSLWSG